MRNIAQIRRKLHAVSFQLRQARVVAKAMKSRHHPIVAHIIPIRRCNLACAYCSEFDDSSKPIPLEAMLRRIDRLGCEVSRCSRESWPFCQVSSVETPSFLFRSSKARVSSYVERCMYRFWATFLDQPCHLRPDAAI
jgi:hypothetical protein